MAATLDVIIPVTATFMCFTWPLQWFNHDCSMSIETYSSSSTPRSFCEVRNFKAQAHVHHTRTREIHHKLAEVVQWCLLAEHHLNGRNIINRKLKNDNTIETYALSEKFLQSPWYSRSTISVTIYGRNSWKRWPQWFDRWNHQLQIKPWYYTIESYAWHFNSKKFLQRPRCWIRTNISVSTICRRSSSKG